MSYLLSFPISFSLCILHFLFYLLFFLLRGYTSVLHTSFFIIYSHRNIFLQLFIHSFSVLPFSLIFPVNLFNHYNTIFYFLSSLFSLFIICFTKYFELIIIYKIDLQQCAKFLFPFLFAIFLCCLFFFVFLHFTYDLIKNFFVIDLLFC